jgi:hypothetical protein
MRRAWTPQVAEDYLRECEREALDAAHDLAYEAGDDAPPTRQLSSDEWRAYVAAAEEARKQREALRKLEQISWCAGVLRYLPDELTPRTEEQQFVRLWEAKKHHIGRCCTAGEGAALRTLSKAIWALTHPAPATVTTTTQVA